MATSFISELAFAEDTTPGTPPSSAANWVTEGFRVRHLSETLDVSSVVTTALEDARSQESILDYELMVQGLRNGELPFSVYTTGTGSVTADTVQVAQVSLGNMYENAMGGADHSNSTTAAVAGAHTTTAIEMDSDTNMSIGSHIAWEHPTTGELYVRRLLANPSTTLWDLDEALPQAAADGDIVHGCSTYFVDPDVLATSDSADRTWSGWVRKSGSDLETYEFNGCKLQLGELAFPRNELPTTAFAMMYARVTYPHESPPIPSWTATPDGFAPVAIGPDMDVFFQDYGADAQAHPCLAELTVTPGLPILRDETVTEAQDNMEGTCMYYLGRGETTAQLTIPFETGVFDDVDNGQFKAFRYSKRASSGGQGFAFSMPRAEVIPTPNRTAVSEESKVQFTLKAHRDTAAIGTTNLARSPFYIIQF